MTERKFQPGIVGKTNVVEGAVIPWFGEQLVNYTMLYNEGDECTDVTGGWGIDGYSRTDNLKISAGTKNTSNMYLIGNANTANGQYFTMLGMKNFIDMTEFSRVGFQGKATSVLSNTYGKFCINASVIKNKVTSDYAQSVGDVGYLDANVLATKFVDVSECNEMAVVYVYAQISNVCRGYFYNIFAVKPDDYNALCDIAGVSTFATVDALIADTTAISTILSNSRAVGYMVKRCTGDFMASFVASSACLSLLESSPYKSIVQANPHWAKFLAMVA